MTEPILFARAAALFFAAGLIGGLAYPRVTLDIFIHDTYYVIATWMYILAAGALFSFLAGITTFYPWLTGRHLDRILGLIHFWVSFIAVLAALACAQIVGVTNTSESDAPWRASLFAWSRGALLVALLAQLLLVANLLGSLFRGERFRA